MSQRSKSMTIHMGLERSVVVMVGLFGTITNIRNDVEIVPSSRTTRTVKTQKKNTMISIGERIIEQCQVVILILMLAGDSVRQRKPSGQIRRRGKPSKLKLKTRRRSVKKYSTSSMNSLTSRGRLRRRESRVMIQLVPTLSKK